MQNLLSEYKHTSSASFQQCSTKPSSEKIKDDYNSYLVSLGVKDAWQNDQVSVKSDLSDVLAANEKVEHYKERFNQSQKELRTLQACIKRGVIFPEVNGEKPLYCSEEAILEEINFYKTQYLKASEQRNSLWFEHMGEAFIS